ncbi:MULTISPECIES: hypothetical protein [Mesotoga]|uniref:hypothetical protein n=1 Tax=Mesotoga TaxID=1184396 RepID=UPI001BD26A9B|nr:hypothetical protein [Mesotoga prima]HNQ71409.1 hypothetical protein [Mesotoga prima]HNS76053.1 hypothetical protein [Mesotoga prima]HQC15643.1 hypothetical protein [Mesotoga prima]
MCYQLSTFPEINTDFISIVETNDSEDGEPLTVDLRMLPAKGSISNTLDIPGGRVFI